VGKSTPAPKAKEPEAEPQDEFGQGPQATQEVSQSFNPNMIGDFWGKYGIFNLNIRTRETQQNPKGIINAQTRAPFPASGAIKLAENESPRPQDRVFAIYRNYENLQGPPAIGLPFISSPQYDLAQTVLGFEKTFLGGDASIGMRLPFFNLSGTNFRDEGVGDLGVILKYALINDRITGDVLSTGIMLTLPTGDVPEALYGDIHSTLIQPYVGYIVNWDNIFLQGFSSIVIPTDNRDVTMLFNDVGIGYLMYRGLPGSFITAVVPTIEAHVTTPLGANNVTDPVFVPDLLVLTGGVHFQISGRSTFTLAGAVPVAGERVFDFESMLMFNLRF